MQSWVSNMLTSISWSIRTCTNLWPINRWPSIIFLHGASLWRKCGSYDLHYYPGASFLLPTSRRHPGLSLLDDCIISTIEKTGFLEKMRFLVNYKKSHPVFSSGITSLRSSLVPTKRACGMSSCFSREISSKMQISSSTPEQFHTITSMFVPSSTPVKLRDKQVLLQVCLKQNLLRLLNLTSLLDPILFHPHNKITLWIDASLSGWGAQSVKGLSCQGILTKEELNIHTNTLDRGAGCD